MRNSQAIQAGNVFLPGELEFFGQAIGKSRRRVDIKMLDMEGTCSSVILRFIKQQLISMPIIFKCTMVPQI